MLNEVKNYLFDKDYKIIILKDKINIVNYQKIITLEEKKIVVDLYNERVIIKGNNLKLVKMIDEELLISGNLKTLEVEDNE